MRKTITFTVDDTRSFMRSSDDYFLRAGFSTRKDGKMDALFYERGSVLLNMVTFNPLKWNSKINITLKSNQVEAVFDINTFGQMVTPKEEQLWSVFIENYKKSIQENVDLDDVNVRQLRDTQKNSVGYVKSAIVGAVIIGIPFWLIGYYYEKPMAGAWGMGFGAVIFMLSRMESERKKNGGQQLLR